MSQCVVFNNDSGNGGTKPNNPTIKSNKDKLFDPSVDMMVNDFDDERTLEEEEALAAKEAEDPQAELCSLQKEGDMPLEELLALYGYGGQQGEGGGEGEGEGEGGEASDAESEGGAEATGATETTDAAVPPDEEDEDEEVDDDDEPPQPSELSRLYEEPLNDPEPMAVVETGAVPNTAAGTVVTSTTRSNATIDDASRLLRSVSRAHSDEEEEDYDYSPDEDEWKKTIMVGSDYQAVIPDGLSSYGDALPYENEDKLLWHPYSLSESAVEQYLVRANGPNQDNGKLTANSANMLPRVTGPPLRDDEQALFLLLQCGHNVDEALRRTRINHCAPPPAHTMSLWSEDECRNFENGLRAYGKDFHMIQQHKVRTRSVGELVQFYYLWKKTERHDVFANKTRLEKKKYTLHPGLTDFMDRFLEEQERDRSSSPNNTTGNSGTNAQYTNNANQTDTNKSNKSQINSSSNLDLFLASPNPAT